MRAFFPITRLGLRLLARVVLASSIFALLLVAIIGLLAYRSEISARTGQFDEVRQSIAPLLAGEISEKKDANIGLLLTAVAHILPEARVRVEADDGRRYEAGRAFLPADAKTHEIKLTHPHSGTSVGRLLIAVDPAWAWEQAIDKLESGILVLLAFIVLFATALSLFVRHLIVSRLAILADQTGAFEPDSDSPLPSLPDLSDDARRDEIDDLAAAFVRMQQRIRDDLQSARALQEQLSRQALRDPLTELGNRAHLALRAREQLGKAGMREVAFVFIDIDRLKLINDTLGHSVGDQLLRTMARRMEAALPERVELFRPGSDEFLLLIPDASAQPCVEQVIIDLQTVMAAAFSVEHHEISITISIGVAISPNHGQELSQLLKHADIALQAAKRNGRGNTSFFNPSMLVNLNERVRLESLLRHALERGEFEIHYQPQIELGSGRLLGAEALLRWNHPELGTINPEQFIPVAEDSGQIVTIGAWVFATACREARLWCDAGLTELTLSVNVSVSQLRHAGLSATIRAALTGAGLPGERLEVEVTESTIMDDVNQAAECLEALRALGIRVAVDDFGTGYSSLAYLKHLPIDRLKIDRAFITDIPQDGNDTAIAVAVIRLAEALNMSVIAEGVENFEQAELLLAKGCPSAQGYYFARPLPAAQFLEFALGKAGIRVC